MRRREQIARWAALLALTAGVTFGVGAVGLPSPALFAGLVVGLGAAVTGRARVGLPDSAGVVAQALLGAAIGLLLTTETLEGIGADWAPVLLVCGATLAISVAAGLALTRLGDIDVVSATLGSVAGGASGIVAMAADLRADERMVAVLQYLRVLVIVLTTPLLVPLLFDVGRAGEALGADRPGLVTELGLTLGLSVAGVAFGRLTRLPAGTVLGPLLVAGALAVAGGAGGARVPGLVQDVSFAVLGLQVGLRFTPASLRQAGGLLGPALLLIAALMAASAALAVALAALTDVSYLDAYLATTPGGLYAVAAVAIDTGSDAAFVLAVQVVRVFLMLLGAPPLVRWLARRRPDRGSGSG